jgi:hypothetical protein
MDESTIPTRRSVGWTISLASVFLALLMTILMVQGLSAQTSGDSEEPAPASGETGEHGEGEGSALEAGQSPSGTIELAPGSQLSATEPISAGQGITPALVVAPVASQSMTAYLPLINKPLQRIIISGTQANSNNQWQVQWQSFGPGFSYRFQESQRPDFSDLITDEILTGLSKDIAHEATAWNTYYYRVRPEGNNLVGPWSRTLVVAGAYFDDFSNPDTGWAMRRTTFLEETAAWYGEGSNAGNFIIVVADRWDWMIASPLQAAPKPPYVLEYRARVHDASNLVSGGVVVGGDWNYDACPEFGNVYQTDNCFNEFYNFNYIHYGAMKLLFEQIDELFWCPECGGSPIKRLGDESNWAQIDPIFGNSNARDWHTYQIEVRDSGLFLTIDGSYKGQFGTPDYVNNPFFGVFASTDEYKPSIWFYDYFKVTPLDS